MLCLGGFELYPRWVPLYSRTPLQWPPWEQKKVAVAEGWSLLEV